MLARIGATTLIALTACTSVQWEPIPTPPGPDATPGMARIRVAREWTAYLSAISQTIVEGDRPVGLLKNGGRLVWEREPGTAVIGLGGPHYDQYLARRVRNGPDLEIVLEAGHTYTFAVTPMTSPRAEERKQTAGDSLVAWSAGWDVWELRLIEEEEDGARIMRATRAASFKQRKKREEPKIYEGPGISLPIPPIGERTIEYPDGSGVAFTNSWGHTMSIEWTHWPDGEQVPSTAINLRSLVTTRLGSGEALGSIEVLHSKTVEGDRPMVYIVARVVGGATVRERGSAENPDATRGMLVFFEGRTMYILSFQWGLVPLSAREGNEDGKHFLQRLLDFFQTIGFVAHGMQPG